MAGYVLWLKNHNVEGFGMKYPNPLSNMYVYHLRNTGLKTEKFLYFSDLQSLDILCHIGQVLEP